MTTLPEVEYRVLDALTPGETLSLEELIRRIGERDKTTRGRVLALTKLELGLEEKAFADQSYVFAGVKRLSDRGLIVITETPDEELSIVADDGLEAEWSGLPERKALGVIIKAGGTVTFQEMPNLLGKSDVRAEVKWLTKKGWCRRAGGTLEVTEAGRQAHANPLLDADESLLQKLRGGTSLLASGVEGVNVPEALKLLRGRDDIIKVRKRTRRKLALTNAGEALKQAGIKPALEATRLTPELLVSGKWREVVFKPYNPQDATAPAWPGKEHPLQRVIQEVRRAFFEMGFEEVASPAVDTAFWVFDALFQPQDHPAREMQDTFYIAEPEVGRLPDDALVRRVARTHEDGGDTGSTGWRCRWDPEKARKLVLRTHTTAASIRALAANPAPPRKVFCVGKTFRRENMDQTHLAEFTQIDGIIIDEDATLATLFGTLEAFYRKMGAEDVRFRPSFFPYTEPSAEVFAKMGDLGWVEMCGAGIFRPEVTEPLGCRAPVLAWGGGVERIAMLRFGLDDIRKLYLADIDWLRNARLGR